MDRLILSSKDAVFLSIQGEGKLTGVPSIFIRLAGCNLYCCWHDTYGNSIKCDTAYASYEITDTISMSVSEVYERIITLSDTVTHIVITGGEPLMQKKNLQKLCTTLKESGYHITLETNGTIYDPDIAAQIDLISISPKLRTSVNPKDKNAEIHEKLRINHDILEKYIKGALNTGKDIQLKFVVSEHQDIIEIEEITKQHTSMKPEDILLMSLGSDTGTMDQTVPDLVDTVISHGWRYCDRLHIRLFGNMPGK